MGWWGYNVMEGDTPLDWECNIESAIGVDRWGDEDDAWENGTKQVESYIKAGDYTEALAAVAEDDEGIAMQVFGELVMCYGGPMSDELKAQCIASARQDEWSLTQPARQAAMVEYIKRVEQYNGVAIEPISKGLLATIAAHEGGGLVNV